MKWTKGAYKENKNEKCNYCTNNCTGMKDFLKWCIDGLVRQRQNSIANALELHLSFTNLSIWNTKDLNRYELLRIGSINDTNQMQQNIFP